MKRVAYILKLWAFFLVYYVTQLEIFNKISRLIVESLQISQNLYTIFGGEMASKDDTQIMKHSKVRC